MTVGTPGSQAPAGPGPDGPDRQLIAAEVGSALVYIEQVGEPAAREEGIYAVAAPTPGEVFDRASEALRECVRVVGAQVEALAESVRPDEVSVEFTISFEAEGKASIVPVFVTGRSSVSTGLAVTAVWRRGPATPDPAGG
ncbi:MAG TPA: CU044_2847 family protein [Thermoleophilaceae bacterium]|jgi:hypothetical protein